MQQQEINEAVTAIEKKMHQVAGKYSSDLDGIKDRLKEVEQGGAGGFSGGLGGASIAGQGNSFSEVLLKSDSVQSYLAGEANNAKTKVPAGVFLKNTIIGEAGSPPEPSNTLVQTGRMQGVVPGAFRSLNILDFIPIESTESNQIEYPRELAWTNNAGETSEGGQKPESVLSFELVTDPVRTIAHFIKTSVQAYSDSPWLQRYLADRMVYGVRARLQQQIVSGDGTTPNLAGITTSGRHTAFTPSTNDTILDSINRAKYLVLNADYNPNFVMINPTSLGEIEREKRGTDAGYLLADGQGIKYVSEGAGGVLWSLPVIISNDIAEGKFILGDRNALRLVVRQDAEVQLFDQDGDNVQLNLLTIRAEARMALAVLVPSAILYGDLSL